MNYVRLVLRQMDGEGVQSKQIWNFNSLLKHKKIFYDVLLGKSRLRELEVCSSSLGERSGLASVVKCTSKSDCLVVAKEIIWIK